MNVQTKATGAPVRVNGVVKKYKDATALDGVDLDINAGEFITLLGSSGSGKSTLLNIIAGFTTCDSGTVEVDGEDITRTPPHRRGLGMVFQHYALFPHMTVAENVAFPLRRRKVAKAEIGPKVAEALDIVQLGHLSDRMPSQLSGGQQQRVALARAIVFRPNVLLMDEPLGALDRRLREQLQFEIKRLHRELGITFVFVTHDQEEALAMSDRIALLRDGQIVQIGSPEDLYERPSCRYSAEFLGESNIFARDGSGPVMVRPENIRLQSSSTPDAADSDSVDGVLREVIYLGSEVRAEALLSDGDVVIARCNGRALSGLVPGEPVRISWRREDGLVLPAEAG